jgi:hypothetical protein
MAAVHCTRVESASFNLQSRSPAGSPDSKFEQHPLKSIYFIKIQTLYSLQRSMLFCFNIFQTLATKTGRFSLVETHLSILFSGKSKLLRSSENLAFHLFNTLGTLARSSKPLLLFSFHHFPNSWCKKGSIPSYQIKSFSGGFKWPASPDGLGSRVSLFVSLLFFARSFCLFSTSSSLFCKRGGGMSTLKLDLFRLFQLDCP